MKIGILGTGIVGSTIGGKLTKLGHDVMMGSRTATNEKAAAWVAQAGPHASQGAFADAAHFGELLINCTSGGGSLAALELAGTANMAGKILLDISNPLDFSRGFPPRLSVCNDDSLGEQIQRALPGVKVVKTLNTMTCTLMVDPGKLKGEHDVFVSGNDAGAKGTVSALLREWFGWKNVIDLGDIATSRSTEGYLLLWTRLYGAQKTADFNIHVVR